MWPTKESDDWYNVPEIRLEPSAFGVLHSALTYSEERKQRLAKDFGFRWEPVTDPREVVLALIQRLSDERAWVKNAWVQTSCTKEEDRCTDAFCFMGHVRDILWGNAESSPGQVYSKAQQAYLSTVYSLIEYEADTIARTLNPNVTGIIDFNDYHDTVWAEVYTIAKTLSKRMFMSHSMDMNVWKDIVYKANSLAAMYATDSEPVTTEVEDNDEPPF